MDNGINNTPLGQSLTKKGKTTRTAILEMAHEVFKEFGYYGSSVSEVTRRCGVSMGTFYRYFRNKEQVFLELNDLIISRFVTQAASLPTEGPDFEERFRKALHLLYNHTKDNFAFNRILGESELIDRVTIGYYDSIARYYRNFLRMGAQNGHIRLLDPNMVAYGLIGLCYFNSLDWGTEDIGFSQEQVVDLIMDLIMNGISGPTPWKRSSGWSLLTMPDPTPLHSENRGPLTKGEETRQALFRAGEKVFGQHGINRANIAEITRGAGVAQGTFYVHFESKDDLIEGFVKHINHQMRRELQRVVVRTQDRRDAERVGILAFFDFLRKHREIYRMVPECEMISREVALWYYEKMAQGYSKGLRQGIQKGEIRDFPAVFLTRSLMGFTHFIALKWIVWNTAPQAEISNQMFQDIIEFLFFGLRPSRK
ncbi:MAG: TetR/AcrR family transcriptional regulator [Desulfobacteraceae bacterium]|nr:TetR/AcrR family transcriptional regulator [Desulfobacteraceae bacterium]